MFPNTPTPRPAGGFRPTLEPLGDRAVPAVIATADGYAVAAGTAITVGPEQGVLVNDFSDTQFGDVLVAAPVGRVVAQDKNGVQLPQALPTNTLTLNPNGSFTLVAPSNLPTNAAKLVFQYRATNFTDPTEQPGVGTVTVLLTGNSPALYAVGTDAGAPAQVKVYQAGTNLLRFTLQPYEASFTGGVRVATGDLNQDGVDDIVCAPGFGGGPRIVVFDGASGAPIFDDLNVFGDPNFRGGAYVAVGDVDGNGLNDIIVGAGETGAPRVTVLSFAAFGISVGGPFTKIADFYAYEPTFRDGVRVAAGDTEGVGRDNIVTAPGYGGGPVVKVFDYQTVTGNVTTPTKFAAPVPATAVTPSPVARLSFYAGPALNRDGLFVATGQFRGDGKADIVTGSGPSGAAYAQIFDGRNAGLLKQFTIPISEVPAGGGNPSGPGTFGQQNPPSGTLLQPGLAPNALIGTTGNSTLLPGVIRGGVRVTTVDWDGDGLDEVVTAPGPGNVARVRVYSNKTGTELSNALAFDTNFLGGVNVG